MITIEEQWLISIRRGPDCDGEMTGFETLEEAEAEARRLGYTHTVRWYNLFAIGDDGEQLDDDPLFVSRPYRGVPNAKFNHGGINTVSPQGN